MSGGTDSSPPASPNNMSPDDTPRPATSIGSPSGRDRSAQVSEWTQQHTPLPADPPGHEHQNLVETRLGRDYARTKDGGARSGCRARTGDGDGSAASGGGTARAIAATSNVLGNAGELADCTGAMVIFFGGQSMFLAKLGACDAVSSF